MFNVQGEFNDAIGATGCQLCAENSFATDKIRESPCDQCAPGRTSKNGSTKCSDCAPGKFKNGAIGFEVCTECPFGFAQSDTDQTFCTRCIKGEEAPTIASRSCTKCDLGKFNLNMGQNCSACPAGQYQDGKGETSCKECGVDTYLIELGKSSNADCTTCSAGRSTGVTTGNTNAASCLCKRSDDKRGDDTRSECTGTVKDPTFCGYYQDDQNSCQPCPRGADCSLHDGMLLSEIFARPGYYRPSTHTTTFTPCIQPERCCPLDPDTQLSVCNTSNTSLHPDTHCSPG